MKSPVAAGKILNFNNGKQKYLVTESDGVFWGVKGFKLVCKCTHSDSPEMIDKTYHFDDRVFRDYNNNNIVVEDRK